MSLSKKQANFDAKVQLMERYVDNLPLFCAEQLMIRSKDGKMIPFVLNKPQIMLHNFLERMLNEEDMVRAEILKARQQGFSTYLNARNFHRTIFNKGWQSFVFAHDTDSSNALFKMIRRFYENPQMDGLHPVSHTENYQELSFKGIHSSLSVGTAGSKGLGRGKTFNSVHSSETAFQDKAEEHLTGLLQTVPDKGKTEIVLESTANGAGNIFYDMCMRSINKRGDFRIFFSPFFWSEDYKRDATDFTLSDVRPNESTMSEVEYYNMYKNAKPIPMTLEHMAWRRHKIEGDFNGDVGKFKQEYPCDAIEAFEASSGNSHIKPEWIRNAKLQETIAGYEDHPIIMGIDPAGTGGDKFVVCIRQGRNILGIFILDPNSDTTINTNRVIELIEEYNPSIINIDTGGLGLPIYDTLRHQNFGARVKKVSFGGEPRDKDRFRYKMDEMFYDAGEWYKNGPISMYHIAQEVIEQVISQACGRLHQWDVVGRFLIEAKDKFKARLGYSPDIWDAIMLTFATVVAAGKAVISGGKTILAKSRGLGRPAYKQPSGRRKR